MSIRGLASLAVLMLLPGFAAADISRRVDPLVFSIHVDLLSIYDLEDLRRHLEDARALFQGSQGPTDVACCTQIDAIDLQIFGTPGDGLDVIDSQAKQNQVISMNALVLDITYPNPGCGKGTLDGDGMIIALDCGNVGQTIAHERGHNAGLNHRSDDSCQPIMGSSRGCLNISECNAFRALCATDGVCTCLDPSIGGPPLPDGAACSLDGEAGVCRAGGVCIEGVVSFFPYQKISAIEGGFTGSLDDYDHFYSVDSLGDLDGDGVDDLAVGAWGDDDGGLDRGAVWILFLNPNGTVKAHQKISDTQGSFSGALDDEEFFGSHVTSLGDLDGDGVGDLAVGVTGDDDGGLDRGAVWILFLNPNGTVKAHQKISTTQGGFLGTLDEGDAFGSGVTALGDLDGDGVSDLAVGTWGDDDGGPDRGAVWVLFLYADGTVKSHQKISDTQGGFTGTLDDGDFFGYGAAALGDLDGDAVGDLAVGAWPDDDGGLDRGAVWVLFLNPNGTVKSHQKISDTQGSFTGALDDQDWFGSPVSSLGDLDGDGVGDLAVGVTGDDDGGENRGAVWILYLNADGTVKSHQKISNTQGGFLGTLDDGDRLGFDVAALGDLGGDDGDGERGVGGLAVTARDDDDGGLLRAATNIAAGDFHSCAIQAATGNVVCWGRDDYGQATPLDAVNGVSGTATDIAAGEFHSCGIQAGTANVVCWGRDNRGQATPLDAVNGVSGTATDIAAGDVHSCAIQAGTGKVVCWGRDNYGQATSPNGVDVGAVWILFLPEPDPTLLLVFGIGGLIVLHRIRRLRVR